MPPPRPGDLYWPVETFTFTFPLRRLLGAWWKGELQVNVNVRDPDQVLTFEDTKGKVYQHIRKNLSVSVTTP